MEILPLFTPPVGLPDLPNLREEYLYTDWSQSKVLTGPQLLARATMLKCQPPCSVLTLSASYLPRTSRQKIFYLFLSTVLGG